MIYTGSPLTNADAHAAHLRNGSANGWPTLRIRRHAHAKPRPFPSPVIHFANPQPSARTSHQLYALIARGWKHYLTNAQRAAWTTTASLNTVTTLRGIVKLLTGPQLFQYFNWYNAELWAQPCRAMSGDFTYLYADPPAAWTPPTTPILSNDNVSDGPYIGHFHFTSTPGITIGTPTVIIPSPWNKALPNGNLPMIRLRTTNSITTNGAGFGTVHWQSDGVTDWSTPPTGSIASLRITGDDGTPSNPTEFFW